MSCFVAGTFAKVPVMGNKIRLTDNWEFLRQDVGNIWELVRPIKKGQPEEQPIWTKVTLPHCFNAEDAVDPDLNYYQGPGWYKTRRSWIIHILTDGWYWNSKERDRRRMYMFI